MFIIQIQANPSGSRPPLQSWNSANLPDGYAFLTDEQKDIFYSTTPAKTMTTPKNTLFPGFLGGNRGKRSPGRILGVVVVENLPEHTVIFVGREAAVNIPPGT